MLEAVAGSAELTLRRSTVPQVERAPRRLHRTRRTRSATPRGAIYVGRPTWWSNPFEGRAGIGHARSVILYRTWLAGGLDEKVLRCAHFSSAEIEALARWRSRLLPQLDELAGFDLQCWCPLTSEWCHADVLLRIANSWSTGR